MTESRSSAAVGFTIFASVMLLLVGVFQALAGLAALLKDGSTIYATTADTTYSFALDTTTWGWTHLLIGVVVFVAGLGLLSGQVWARTVGVIVAGLAAVANFMFIPIYPWWSITIIALCVAVIWALTIHGRDITSE